MKVFITQLSFILVATSASVGDVKGLDIYAVFSGALSDMYYSSGYERLVVAPVTVGSNLPPNIKNYYAPNEGSKIPVELIDKLVEKNQTPMELDEDRFDRRLNVVIFDEAKLERADPSYAESKKDIGYIMENYWNVYYKAYPGSQGQTYFSEPAISIDGKAAVIYMSTSKGFLAGYGSLVLLHNKEGEWKIDKEVILWVS